MKKLPLKLKLTLFYSFFMVLISGIALAILFSLSSREILSSAQNMLKEQVSESLDDIELRDGTLKIDSDFYSLEHDIYLAVYSPDGQFLYGKVPHGMDTLPDLADGELQTVREKNRTWYTYDILFSLEKDHIFFIRGYTSASKAEQNFHITLRFALILLPLMIFLTALTGYRLVSRALRPVRLLTDTVEKIRSEGDLSLRTGSHPDTDQKRDEIHYLADTFDLMLDQLEDAFQREKQFTSDVSHELRTPVTVIAAQSEALMDDPALPEELRPQVAVICRKSRQMASLISQLLLLTRADQGRAPLSFERLNISEMTEMTVEEQMTEAEAKNITIHTDITPDIFADVDQTSYFRLLINLLSNAIYYGVSGGNVWLSLRTGFPVGADATNECEQIILEVRDDGIGMSEEVLAHIWERFYRADPSRTDGNHSGLGLSMVQWITTAHSGTIHVKSQPGKGSTFTVVLPLHFQPETIGIHLNGWRLSV